MRELAYLLLALGVIAALPGRVAMGDEKGKTVAKKDVAKEALALPPSTVLRSDQDAKYREVKAFYEPKLRQAAAKLEGASASEKHKAYRQLKKLRDEVEGEIAEILKMPGPTTSSRAGSTGSSAVTPRGVVRQTRPTAPRALRAATPRGVTAPRVRPYQAAGAARY